MGPNFVEFLAAARWGGKPEISQSSSLPLTGGEPKLSQSSWPPLTGAGNPNSALLRLGSSNRFAITFYLSVSLRRIWNGPAFCWLRRQYQEYL